MNRNTVRQAIGELVSQGLLRKEKGRGTFVISKVGTAVKHRLKRISSFADDLKEAGVVAKTAVLKKGVETPSESVARSLVLGPGQKVGVIHRLRTGDGIPLIYAGQESGEIHKPSHFEKEEIDWKNINEEIFDFYKDLMLLRKNNPVLSSPDLSKLNNNQPDKIVSYLKKDRNDEVVLKRHCCVALTNTPKRHRKAHVSLNQKIR